MVSKVAKISRICINRIALLHSFQQSTSSVRTNKFQCQNQNSIKVEWAHITHILQECMKLKSHHLLKDLTQKEDTRNRTLVPGYLLQA